MVWRVATRRPAAYPTASRDVRAAATPKRPRMTTRRKRAWGDACAGAAAARRAAPAAADALRRIRGGAHERARLRFLPGARSLS